MSAVVRSVRKSAVWAVALVLAVAATVHADEDAGTSSVLNFGAGNRALALGGAYGAIANDASAPVWNPGGLGLVWRRQFEATQTSFFGMGFSEQYMSVVIPSWRWGAAGITFHRFGVDGIDVRDDRNVVLGEDESDNETRLSFTYGRSLSPAWNVGASLKLQRQSLVGIAATGVGIDLGVIARPGLALGVDEGWAHHFTMGLTLRNVLEPSIRLVEESVQDPTSARLSFAHWVPIGTGHALLGAFDVVKTKGMGPRFHFGVEAKLHELVSVRTGINHSFLTAGTGFHWRDASFDYVFENNVIHGVHRFGVSYRFGPTIDESRRAALQAEGALLNAKLTEAFRIREAQRIERLLTQAEAARSRNDFDEALRLIESVKVLDAGNPKARTLEITYLIELASRAEQQGDYANAAVTYGQVLTLAPEADAARQGLARVRSESDRRAKRSAALRRQFATAMDAFSAENFAAAQKGLQAILKSNPQDTEASVMLRRTEEAMKLRTRSLMETANRLVQSGNYTDAIALLKRALQVNPSSANAERLLAEVRTLEARERAQQPEDTVPSPQPSAGTPNEMKAPPVTEETAPAEIWTEQQELEVADLYRRGMAAIEHGRVDDALRYWELVWSVRPGYQQVGENLKREYLLRGMGHFAAGDLNGAMRDWEAALRIDPTDQRAIGYLARAQEQRNRTQQILGRDK